MRRAAAAAVVVLLASHTLLAATVLVSNQRRKLLHAFAAPANEVWSTTTTRLSPVVRAVVGEVRRVEIVYTHWELVHWSFMRLNPSALDVTGQRGVENDLLLVPLHRSLDVNDAMPLLPVKAELPGVFRLAGRMNAEHDLVFCFGPTCESVCGACERHLLLPMAFEHGQGEMTIHIGLAREREDPSLDRTWASLRIRQGREGWPSVGDWIPVFRPESAPLTVSVASGSSFAIDVNTRRGGSGKVKATTFNVRDSRLTLVTR